MVSRGKFAPFKGADCLLLSVIHGFTRAYPSKDIDEGGLPPFLYVDFYF